MPLFTGHTITPDSALGGVQIQRSLRFNSADNEYLIRTCSSEGNRVKWTWSGWVKRTRVDRTSYALLTSQNDGDGGGNNGIGSIYFHSDNKIHVYYDTTGSNNSGAINDVKYRDTNSWYHIVWQVDAANSASKIWVNGVEQSVGVQPVSGYNYTMNQAGKRMTIGVDAWDLYTYSDTYIAETHFSDGQLYAASDFGYTDAQTGQWRPKNGNVIKSNITYGTNGFWLDFRDATSTTTLGYDYSGNGNHWTLTNMSVANGADVNFTSDTPTSNFCVMSDVDKDNITCTNGGLELTQADPSVGTRIRGTYAMPPNTGKYYYEMEIQTGSSYVFGMKSTYRLGSGTSGNEERYAYYGHNGNKLDASSSTSYGATYSGGDKVAILYDSDSGEVYFYKNNVSQGLAFTGVNTTDYHPFVYLDNYGTSPIVHMNFGQRPFAYTPPTGARGLSSKIFPTPVPAGIVRPQRHFDSILYTGNGSTQSPSGLEFTPDFVWIKARSVGHSHDWFDSVRGVSKTFYSNGRNEESSFSGLLTSFHRGGFTVGNWDDVNQNGTTYVAWCWKAGGAAVTNNDGNITSSVSANQEAGFSVATYTGSTASGALTVGHGLGRKPAWVIIKRRDGGNHDWIIGHQGLATNAFANNKFLKFETSGTFTNSLVFGVEPTTTVTQIVTDGSAGASNLTSTGTYVMYSWAEIPGYSSFGSYIGNGSDDGPYVHLGFKAAWIMIKLVDGGNDDWPIYDNKRDPDNPCDHRLFANASTAEGAVGQEHFDILSNGIKFRKQKNPFNNSGKIYIYMAFAERPSGTRFGLDANAR